MPLSSPKMSHIMVDFILDLSLCEKEIGALNNFTRLSTSYYV